MIEVTEKNAAEVARTVKGGAVVGPSSVRRSPSIAALAAAMVRVQAEIDDPTKNKRADAGSKVYRYADLPTVLDAVRPALTRHGLAVMQFPAEMDGQPALTTLMIHGGGDWIETTMCLRPVKSDPQAIGSALTYYRRYALLSLCGIAADDDDGKAASTPGRSQSQSQPADNLTLRATLTRAFAAAQDLAGYTAVCDRLVAEKLSLSAADIDYLRGVARETHARLAAGPKSSPQNQPAPAGK